MAFAAIFVLLAATAGLDWQAGLAEYSQHFGLALSLGIKSKALMVPEKIDFEHQSCKNSIFTDWASGLPVTLKVAFDN